MVLIMLKMGFGIPFRVAFKANLCDAVIFITFWIHLAFDPFQYYPVSSATFVRVSSGYHLKFLDTTHCQRAQICHFWKKSKGVSGLWRQFPKEFWKCFLGRSPWSPNTTLKVTELISIHLIRRIVSTSMCTKARGLLHIPAHYKQQMR